MKKNEIFFNCRFGIWPFRKNLEIACDRFVWCGQTIEIEKIEAVRWGVFKLRGGILPKFRYYVAFTANGKEYEIKTKQKDFYGYLSEAVWKSAGAVILDRMMKEINAGNSVKIGSIEVDADGIVAERKKLLSAEKKHYAWEELEAAINDGNICFFDKHEHSLLAALSMLWTNNAHVLLAALKFIPKANETQSGDC